ncbi:MAG: CHAT domain-containing protein [Lewinellaceae bacterium]|nr:CHAT domain-containing protein [Lewinellaceae bacterium]
MIRKIEILSLLLLLIVASSQTVAPESGSTKLEEAKMLLDSARYEQAMQKAQEALQLSETDSPDFANCLLVLGDVFLETGQWDAAFEQYRTALNVYIDKLEPGDLAIADAWNRVGEYYYKKNDFRQATFNYNKALRIREAKLGPQHELVADVYNNLGNCQVGMGNYAEATTLHLKALSIREEVLPDTNADLATSYNNLGNCYYLLGDYQQSYSYFENARLIRDQVYGPEHPKTAQILNNLGNTCVALGRNQEALAFYQRSLSIRRRELGDKHPAIAGTLENIADLLFGNGDYIAALDYYRQAQAIQLDVQGSQSLALASLWHQIGLCYQYEGDFDRAIEQLLAAEPILVKSFDKHHPFIAGFYNNLGNCYAGKKKYYLAEVSYLKSLQIYERGNSQQLANVALVINNLGYVSLESGHLESALNYIDQALKTAQKADAISAGQMASIFKNKGLALYKLGRWPETKQAFENALQFLTSSDLITGIEIRNKWGGILSNQGMSTKGTALLKQSLALFKETQFKSDSLLAQLSNPGSRQRWIELQYPAINSSIESCFALWELTGETPYLESAFAMAERNKSIQLLEQKRKEQAEESFGIPDSLLLREQLLNSQLNTLDMSLVAARENKDKVDVRQLEVELANKRQELSILEQKIEKQYPAYYKQRFNRQSFDIEHLRKNLLSENQTLLEYFVGDSSLFAFVLDKKGFNCVRIRLDFPLDEWVNSLRHSLQAYPNAGERAAQDLSMQYASCAFDLYQHVMAPVQKQVKLPENLIIVPDAALSYLPFECLLTEKPVQSDKFKSHRYLLQNYCISYAYSASQQAELLYSKKTKPTHKLLTIAPTYNHSPFGLEPLYNNQQEAKAVGQMLGGKVLSGESATKQAFLAEAGQYQLLLLSMHGKASSTVGDLSYLAFSSDSAVTANPFLYARELYTQKIPADLVVLSACETSVGSYRFGQGVTSLAKGFFQAGARSVAATLWSVDDAKNAELIQLFFKALKSGIPKDQALRKAKLEFLHNHPQEEAHPVYWAAVGLYGDTAPLNVVSYVYWQVALFLIIGCFLFYYWLRRRGYGV